MQQRPSHQRRHEHIAKRVRVLGQRAGVPHELERTVCVLCKRVLGERSVRRLQA